MKAITIKQPWASLIVAGVKDIENRTWPTNFRGRVLIHAGRAKQQPFSKILTPEQIYEADGKLNYKQSFDTLFPKGSIIGSVEIVNCVINHPSIWAEKTQTIPIKENYVTCPKGVRPTYNWVLANPIRFDEPILNIKGKLSFWNFEL
jgi:hypothetical protein